MIGTRGVRLGVVKPGVYQMQVRALARAVGEALAAGNDPKVEIMIPLVMGAEELAMARQWVIDALDEAGVADFDAVSIGAMVETPRAALVAAELSAHADFFSFGTNDLTQLTFAFSRDDVEVRLLPAYLAAGVLPFNPFEQLDQDGVGRLIELTCRDARAVKPDIKIGICGEQAGDPGSVGSSSTPGSTTSAARPTGCRSPGSPWPRRSSTPTGSPTRRSNVSPPTSPTITLPRRPAHPRPSAGEIDDDEARFLVLHALRIKGFSAASTVAELSTIPVDRTTAILTELAESGHTKFFEARDLWQLTPEGKERHAAETRRRRSDARHRAARPLRPVPRPEHAAEGALHRLADARRRAERPHRRRLRRRTARRTRPFQRRVRAGPRRLRGRVPRFAAYRHRLTGAAARAVNGETKMFTGVMCGSFHDIWMELHEDLIQLLSIDRGAEGSY